MTLLVESNTSSFLQHEVQTLAPKALQKDQPRTALQQPGSWSRFLIAVYGLGVEMHTVVLLLH